MPIVSNTSPILNLAIISQLGLLRYQSDEIIIPPAVLQELKPDEELSGSTLIRQAIQDNWIRVVVLKHPDRAKPLLNQLDRGEAMAIALAVELEMKQILIDEKEGRAIAIAHGLEPIGVLGVLLRAKQTGQINLLKPVLQDLRNKANFFIAPALFSTILKAGDEVDDAT